MTLQVEQGKPYYQAAAATAVPSSSARTRNCCGCKTIIWTILILLFILFIIGLILSLTVFKIKHPRTRITSVTLQGVSPHLTFPAIQIQLNISLGLSVDVRNPNHAAFMHNIGSAVLLYRGSQVGEAELDRGTIPAMGSATVRCHLVLLVDRFGEKVEQLVSDVMGGELPMETKTRIPGKVSLLGGLFHKHAEATSNCQIVIAFPAFNITNQNCSYHTRV